MVSHAPGRLLPTIRSRCRRLAFQPLPLEAAAAFVRDREDVSEEAALRLARMAGGAPGRAWALAGANAIAMDDAARALLESLPRIDEALALSARRASSAAGRGRRNSTCCSRGWPSGSTCLHRPGEPQRAWSGRGAGGLDRWAQAWETLQRLPSEVEALNLDRTDALFTALGELRQAARAA